jgi:hypothetical protein
MLVHLPEGHRHEDFGFPQRRGGSLVRGGDGSAQAHETTRVSVTSTGAQVLAASSDPSISDDGRLIAFTSLATDLVTGDTNGVGDIFVHDRVTGVTTRASVGSTGEQGNDSSLRRADLRRRPLGRVHERGVKPRPNRRERLLGHIHHGPAHGRDRTRERQLVRPTPPSHPGRSSSAIDGRA